MESFKTMAMIAMVIAVAIIYYAALAVGVTFMVGAAVTLILIGNWWQVFVGLGLTGLVVWLIGEKEIL